MKILKATTEIWVRAKGQLGLAWFWLELLGKKARLGSARHILQKKLGSAQLALSVKKPNYLEKTKNELIFNIFATF